jgi:hypothetical protein
VAVIVKKATPVAVGVPDTTPSSLSVRPVGRVPAVSAKV